MGTPQRRRRRPKLHLLGTTERGTPAHVVAHARRGIGRVVCGRSGVPGWWSPQALRGGCLPRRGRSPRRNAMAAVGGVSCGFPQACLSRPVHLRGSASSQGASEIQVQWSGGVWESNPPATAQAAAQTVLKTAEPTGARPPPCETAREPPTLRPACPGCGLFQTSARPGHRALSQPRSLL